ncbi:MAG: hypothetical protein RI568_13650 [Natronomonas sp.]|uniref:hypothetical protein n=1 Tax=Natronomonas sp. TaxID=2184060 RepID=UPI0028709C63|nr:hypothetical protein [Natronomonas sp.]MDR9431727.1 hypothetical protein [Natronomonas sp.]
MPASTPTDTLGEIVDELDEQLDAIAEQASQADDSERQQALDQQGLSLEQQLVAFEELAEEHGEQATVTVAEFTVDERMRFGDLLEAAREQAQERQGYAVGSNMREVYWVGAGVVGAPWLEGDEDMQARITTTRRSVDWPVIQHLRGKVTEANTKGNPERQSYAERREARTPQSEPN